MNNKHLEILQSGCEKWNSWRSANPQIIPDLSGVDFEDLNIDLRGYLLKKVDMSNTYFYSSNLEGTFFAETNLTGAVFRDCSMAHCHFFKTNLERTQFINCNLMYSIFGRSILKETWFNGSNLSQADLSMASVMEDIKANEGTMGYWPVAPVEGAFIGYKKLHNESIAKLLIPEDASRSSATTRKCRASKAMVLEIWDKEGSPIKSERSRRESGFIYRVGETVEPVRPFNTNRWDECSSGIHFFISKEEAQCYDL